MTDREVIALQSWWMGELSQITKRVMADEEKRQNREKATIDKKLGEYKTYADIQDAYGCGVITEKQFDRLADLLEKREAASYRNEMYEEKLALLGELYKTAKEIIRDRTDLLNRMGG